jgi:hypothetical protein
MSTRSKGKSMKRKEPKKTIETLHICISIVVSMLLRRGPKKKIENSNPMNRERSQNDNVSCQYMKRVFD